MLMVQKSLKINVSIEKLQGERIVSRIKVQIKKQANNLNIQKS